MQQSRNNWKQQGTSLLLELEAASLESNSVNIMNFIVEGDGG